jgi:hypothetical protein
MSSTQPTAPTIVQQTQQQLPISTQNITVSQTAVVNPSVSTSACSVNLSSGGPCRNCYNMIDANQCQKAVSAGATAIVCDQCQTQNLIAFQ